MKGSIVRRWAVFGIGFTLLLTAAMSRGEYMQTPQGPPPIAQNLIREGTLATRLAVALNLGTPTSEAQAESWLGERGITPKNGWIADYPITPDITGELYQAVGNAADANKIELTRAEALKRFESITAELAIAVNTNGSVSDANLAPEGDNVVPAGDIYNYYNEEGPPVVTYYPPPYDYYGMYSWVPYPFFSGGFGFNGFFILNDFHRAVFFDSNQQRAFVTNHVVTSNNEVVRVNSAARASGRSGFAERREAIPVGVHGNIRSDYGASRREASQPGMRSMANRTQSTSVTSNSMGGRSVTSRSGSDRSAWSYSGTRSSNGYSYSHAAAASAPSRSYSSPAASYSHSTPSYRASAMSAPSYHSSGGFSGGGSSRGGFSGGGSYGGSFSGGGFSGGHGGGRR
jgi:hypothetical protein